MKKTILLSISSSALLLAGGDILPVEQIAPIETNYVAPVVTPTVEKVVVAPIVEKKEPKVKDNSFKSIDLPEPKSYCLSDNTKKFSGTLGAFGQTDDYWNTKDLLDKDGSALTVAGQLRAEKDLGLGFYGFGELTGTLSNSDVTSGRSVLADGSWTNKGSAAITNAYLGYDRNDLSAKIGRFNIDKTDNPLAYSENWNIVQNSVQGASVGYTLGETVLEATYIRDNNSFGNLSNFSKTNGDNGLYALTVSDNTLPNLNVNAAYLVETDDTTDDTTQRVFTNVSYLTKSNLVGTVQAGATFGDVQDNTYVAGLGLSQETSDYKANVAYSYVNDGTKSVTNRIGSRTPLLTQMLINENYINSDSQSIKFGASTDVSNFELGLDYGITTNNGDENKNFQEIDLHAQKTFGDTDVIGTFAYGDLYNVDKTEKVVRVVAKYDF